MSAVVPFAPVSHEWLPRLRAALGDTLRGKADVIEFVLAAVLARGHLLLEDLPGLGKTTLAKALAHLLGGSFTRVQCTPDLLPGDITGFNVFNQKTREFEFVPGPLFADVVLTDEINRATPRTQSALLEAMAERQVTVDNVRRPLALGFLVLATQNPVEHHGTYPLPEAQLDRFAMKLSVGYPGAADEQAMLAAAVGSLEGAGPLPAPILSPGDLLGIQRQIAQIAVNSAVQAYFVTLAHATRTHPLVHLGLSPRGLLTWQRVAQAWAFLKGRDFITPRDVQDVALPVLQVRLGVERADTKPIIEEILSGIPVPIY